MPRYVIERAFDPLTPAEFETLIDRSNALPEQGFADVVWEHSHVCSDSDGNVKSFCVYAAPNEERVREHASALGQHFVTNLYEIEDDLTPRKISP